MSTLRPVFYKEMSFRSRLLGIVTLGILALALIASTATAWVTSKRTASQMVAQGLQITGTLAEQSVLALLYESRENAVKPLQAILSFPDVQWAGVFDMRLRSLAVIGPETNSLSLTAAPETSGPSLVRETAGAWYFVAPVFAGAGVDNRTGDESPFLLGQPQSELLGYSAVVMNKGTLRELQLSIFLNNIAIALSCALVLLFLLNIGIKRLTRPLLQLAGLMKEAEKDRTHVYADLQGPREITHMASIFNKMMASLEDQDQKLRRHSQILQSEVEIRTRELVQARDAALTASRHKSEFLANMSHELRTPLQAIIGYADVVREELETEGMDEDAEALNRVLTNAQRLLSLINNLLDLAKIEAGHMDLALQSVDLDELVREAGDTILPLMNKNGNRLVVETRHAQPKVEIDREKLFQILLNLLSNAGKFTSNGTVTLQTVRDDQALILRVADTGVGLSEEQQQIIFDEFRQVDGSATRDVEGTGLGLAITRRFCHLMRGTIEVESTPGQGATFTVILPLPIREASERDSFSDSLDEPDSTEGEPISVSG